MGINFVLRLGQAPVSPSLTHGTTEIVLNSVVFSGLSLTVASAPPGNLRETEILSSTLDLWRDRISSRIGLQEVLTECRRCVNTPAPSPQSRLTPRSGLPTASVPRMPPWDEALSRAGAVHTPHPWGMPSLPGPALSLLLEVFSPPRESTNTCQSFISGSASGGAQTKSPSGDHCHLCSGWDWLDFGFFLPG